MPLRARIVLEALLDENRVLAARHGGVALAHSDLRHVVMHLVGRDDARQLGDVPGVPRGDEERIFERFYRCDDSLATKTSGSGLGLSIVLDAAEKNGGSVSAENREEGGMRFRVSFPALNKNG